MSDFIKTKLKALKVAVQGKDWPAVEKTADAVLSFESNNYNARVFLALALFNLERFDEAEENYKKAIEGAPSQPLARQGLAAFYEKRQRWADYAWSLLELMQLFEASQDAPKYAETLQKLVEVRRSHGTRPELIDAISLALPTSTVYPLLSTLPPPNPTAPLATPYHSIQLAVSSPLSALLEVVSLTEAESNQLIEAEIKKRRQRLGGQTLSAADTRRAVEGEFLRDSRLPDLYRAVLEEPDASEQEELRRETERKLLNHLRTLLRALPSSFDAATSIAMNKVEKRKEVKDEEERLKGATRSKVEELASGMVLIGIAEERAWEVVLDWQDRYGAWDSVNWRELERYWDLFPESGLAQIARSSRQLLLASLPQAEDAEPIVAPSLDEMATAIEAGLVQSPDSLLAHLLSAHFFASQQEWDSVVEVTEAGLSVLSKIEVEIGRALPSSRRSFETDLAIALVHLEPPTHHLRALRLLESLIAASPSPSSAPLPLLTAKAYVLQSSEKWAGAVEVWDLVLSAPSLPEATLIEATGERAWSLFHAREFEEAHEGLKKVVDAFEKRKGVRDEERVAKEKARSKAGLEKGEGVEEGETTEEAEERGTAWYRLGECLWEMGETDADLTTAAYNAFISAIRASPTHASAFTSLGVYYRSIEPPDYSRASKCFQKAFELDGGQELAARYLAEEFSEMHEWELVEVIARRVVDGNTGKAALGGKAAQRLAWAYKAIGGSELNSKRYPQAIVAFQSALRGAPSDVHTWVKLGIAYRLSGKFVAALKVFAKALTLDESSWYARFLIGDVQREIGLLEPALKTFREILEDRPDELGVKVVLAETALTAGLEELRGGFVARAEDSFIEALQQAVVIIEAGSATRIAWKVVGDALVNLGKVLEPARLVDTKALALRILGLAEEQQVDTKIDGMDAVTSAMLRSIIDVDESPRLFPALAVLAFKMRVLLETQNETAIGSAWFDLGVAISNVRTVATALSIPTSPSTISQQAIRGLKFALHKEPINPVFWNALGVLSFDISPRLAQHCFIKSVEHNSRNAIPWTNLGLFYLVHGDDDLANQSFLKAQVLDPEWAQAWVGQATLADMAGHAVEASVLLEHAFSLGGNIPEADIGFATSAFDKYRANAAQASSSSLSSRSTAAESLSAPLFALTRYLAQRPDDISGLHLHALVLEQVGDLVAAGTSLEKAAALLEEEYEVDESPETEGRFVMAQTNLGRVRLASEDFEGALGAFDAALSLLSVEDDAVEGGLTKQQSVLLFAECKLGQSLAHYWLGDKSSAEEVLSSAIEDLEGIKTSRHANLAIALGRVYWSEGDEDRALGSFIDAPESTVNKSPLFVKLAIAALAIVTDDKAIMQTVRRNNTSDSETKYAPDIVRLTMLQHLSKNDQTAALGTLGRAVHAAPWQTHHRRQLASLLLSLTPPPSATDPSNTTYAETTARFLRTRVPTNSESAAARTERMWALGVVHLDKSDEEGSEEVGLRFLEKAVWSAPWNKKSRDALDKTRVALHV